MNRKIRFFGLALAVVSLIGAACLGYAYFVEPFTLKINRQTLPVQRWDPAMSGFRIVAISDIHGGSRGATEEKIREVVAAANAQDPDLIVLLGDFVSHRGGAAGLRMPISVIGESLAGLKARHGVLAVLGNHDGKADERSLVAALERTGITVLENEVVKIERDGRKLTILGLKDHLKLEPSWANLSRELSELLVREQVEGDLIVLEHSPDILPVIAGELLISDRLRLILAGHTHGGQVWLPVVGTPIIPSSYGQKYAYGHIRDGGVDMFVTTGIGTSILPIRFMMPPEIAVLEITADGGK